MAGADDGLAGVDLAVGLDAQQEVGVQWVWNLGGPQ